MDVESKLSRALDEAVEALDADSGTIHVKASERLLQLAASREIPQSVIEAIREIDWGKGLAGLAAQYAEPIDLCNIQSTPSPEVHPRARATGMRGVLVVPMMNGRDVVGTIGVGSRNERTFTPVEIEWLMDLGRRVAADLGQDRMAA